MHLHHLIFTDMHSKSPAFSDGSSLIQHHGLHMVGRFQSPASLDQHAILRAHASAHHHGSGGSKAQGTGARHHEHWDCHHEAESHGILAAGKGGDQAAMGQNHPQDESQQAESHHHWDKDTRNAIGKPCSRGAW